MESLISKIQGHEYTPGLECYFPSCRAEFIYINKNKGKTPNADDKTIFKSTFEYLEAIQNLIARTVILHSSKSKGSFNTYACILRLLYKLEKLDLITDEISKSIVEDLSFIEPSFIHFSYVDDRNIPHYYPLQSSIHKAFHQYDIDIDEAKKVLDYYLYNIALGDPICYISKHEVEGCLVFKAIDEIYKDWNQYLNAFEIKYDENNTSYYRTTNSSPFLMIPLLIKELALTREGRAFIFDSLYDLNKDEIIRTNAKISNKKANFKSQLDLILLPESVYTFGFHLPAEISNLLKIMSPLFEKWVNNRKQILPYLSGPTPDKTALAKFIEDEIDNKEKKKEFIKLRYLSQNYWDYHRHEQFPPRFIEIPREPVSTIEEAVTKVNNYYSGIIEAEIRYANYMKKNHRNLESYVKDMSYEELESRFKEDGQSLSINYTRKRFSELTEEIEKFSLFVAESLLKSNPSSIFEKYLDHYRRPKISDYAYQTEVVNINSLNTIINYLRTHEFKGLCQSIEDSIENIRKIELPKDFYNNKLIYVYNHYNRNNRIKGPVINTIKLLMSEITNVYSALNLYEVSSNNQFTIDLTKSLVIYSRLYLQYKAINAKSEYKEAAHNVYNSDIEIAKQAIDKKHSDILIYGYSDFVDIQLPYRYLSTNEYRTGSYQTKDDLTVKEAYHILYNFYLKHVEYANKELRFKLDSSLPYDLLNFELFKAALVIIDRPIVYFAHNDITIRTTVINGTMNDENDFTKLDSYHEEAYKNKDSEFETFSDKPEEYFKFGRLNNDYKPPKAKYVSINLIILTAKRILTYWNCYFDYSYQRK